VSTEAVSIDTATPQQIVARAMSSHAGWTGRLMDAISTHTCDCTVEEASAEDQCSFGQWLHNEVPFRLRKTWDYASVRKRHAELHAQIGRVLELALTGQQAAATAELHAGTPFSVAVEHFDSSLKDWYSRVESQALGNAF
jgi:Chemoreceptor zinc-binding domain